MDLDHTFRTLMVVGCFVLFPIGLYYRLKSQATGERLDRRHEGIFILATLPPLALMYWVGDDRVHDLRRRQEHSASSTRPRVNERARRRSQPLIAECPAAEQTHHQSVSSCRRPSTEY